MTKPPNVFYSAIAVLLVAAILFAQVVTVPNTTAPTVRSLINSNFSWLNANKAPNPITCTGTGQVLHWNGSLWSCVTPYTLSGNTTVLSTSSGTLTSGHCVQIDANGNYVDAGAACGTGGGTTYTPGPSGGITISGSQIDIQTTIVPRVSVSNTFSGLQTFSPGVVVGPVASDPVSPPDGQVWIDSTHNALKWRTGGHTYSATGSTVSNPGSRVPALWVTDGFNATTAYSAVGFGLVITCNTPTIQAATTTALTANRCNTTATAGTSGVIYSPTNFRAGKNLYGKQIAALAQTTTTRAWLGFTSAAGASIAALDTLAASQTAAFRFSTNVPDTHWQCATANGSTMTVTDSGITPDTNQHLFEITIGASNVVFAIDGTTVCTVSATLPTGTLRMLGTINNVANAAVMSLDTATWYAEQDR